MSSRTDIIKQIAEKHNLDIIYAFGSLAQQAAEYVKDISKGIETDSLSDLDIGVKPKPEKYLAINEKIQLSLDFEELFKAKRVDLIVIPEADPFLAANVIRGERIFCSDKDDADEYDLYILRRAGDLAPLERERISLIMENKSR